MKRIYENKGYNTRQNISLAILFAVSVYGVWELANANMEARGGLGLLLGVGGDGYIFGALFIGGGAYGLWQLLNDARDMVATFDVDEATGDTVTTLWRPFRSTRIEAKLADIRDWRYYVKLSGRSLKIPYVFADYPARPRPLIFDLRRADLEGLRTIAPEAVGEFEAATGVSKI